MLMARDITSVNSVQAAINDDRPAPLRGLDMVGVALSTACLIHCTILPLVLALLPMFGSHFHLDEKWHWILTGVIVPVALLALLTGWKRHHRDIVLRLGIISLIMILGAPVCHDFFGHAFEECVATAGSFILISAHIINHKTLRRAGQGCACCH
ncbi:MerC domain-containing protein [bacterium]|nr:MerC domain-containing protein [bacterium]